MERKRLEDILGPSSKEECNEKKKEIPSAMPTLHSTRITFKRDRDFDHITLDGFPVKGSDVTEAFVTFQAKGGSSDVLVFTEIPILLDELANVSNYLGMINGTLSAIHNHWQTKPETRYIHWNKVGNAYDIALELAPLWQKL